MSENKLNPKLSLLIDTNTDLQSLLAINLKTWVNSDTEHRDSAQSALNALSKLPHVNLIITIARRGQERTAEIIFNYLNDHNRTIPMVVVGVSTLTEHENIIHLENIIDLKQVIKACAKLLNVTAQDMAQLNLPQFFSIPINFFSKLKYSAVDLYYFSQNSHLLISNANAPFAEELISNLINEGHEELFVNRNDRLHFVNNATQEFISQIDIESLNENDQILAQESNHDLLRYKLSYMGINDDTIALSQKHLSDIANTVKKHPTLKKLLAKLLSNKTSYLFKHVQILTFIGNHVLKHIDWGNDEQIEKFSFISFFHDILIENDDQAKVRSISDLKKIPLTPKQIELVKTHAQKAAELVYKYPKAPMGVDIIIRQHHGVANGIGFSESYSTNISPLAIVFILSEDFASAIIDSELNFDVKSKIAELREKYTTQRFKKIIDLFETLAI